MVFFYMLDIFFPFINLFGVVSLDTLLRLSLFGSRRSFGSLGVFGPLVGFFFFLCRFVSWVCRLSIALS